MEVIEKQGSTSGGSGVDTTSKGFVDIFKDKIIIEYQNHLFQNLMVRELN
ncbi:MAG: hypothetical protein IPI15_16275 [Saprospiraceae bacterium]|nr:hypothetical protein [Candidatus Brachybacter algidus]MBK7605100.1 hypothetical protein [Candidatus Brachybacter algidus]